MRRIDQLRRVVRLMVPPLWIGVALSSVAFFGGLYFAFRTHWAIGVASMAAAMAVALIDYRTFKPSKVSALDELSILVSHLVGFGILLLLVTIFRDQLERFGIDDYIGAIVSTFAAIDVSRLISIDHERRRRL